MICWIALAVLTLVTAAYLAYRNRQQAAARRRKGKMGEVVDTSLEVFGYKTEGQVEARNEQAFDDLPDTENEDFIYVL